MPDRPDDTFAEDTMQLAIARADDVAVISVTGEVDAVTAPVISTAVITTPVATDRLLVLDLTGVTFFGSPGLAVVYTAARSTPVPVRVVAATRIVTRPLQVSGIDQVVDLYATLDDALID